MSFGGGPSRKDLMDTVESQRKQLLQYQSRFKDVVQAYKSLLKEKEALEASLKVLTVSQEVEVQDQTDEDNAAVSQVPEDGCMFHSEDSLDTAASVETPCDTTRGQQDQELQNQEVQAESLQSLPEDTGTEKDAVGAELQPQAVAAAPAPAVDGERRMAQLRAQLSTLTGALATVTQEKSRMEASFQADKRQLKLDVEQLEQRLAGATARQEAELVVLQQQLAESRARVITQQHEREQEQQDHAQQLRELQKILQQERDLRQDAELRFQDADAALLATSQAVDRGAESEAQLDRLREERDNLKRSLQAAEDQQKKPHPVVEHLQQELSELKNHFQQQIHIETKKAGQAEERARERAQAAELRVADLEQRVSELSEVVGSCEKTRLRDQQTARRLRDRILQLDTENKTLALAASSRASADLGVDEAQLDVSALKDKLEKVKKLLLVAQRSQDPDIQLLSEEPEERRSAAACQLELRQLKEEFERYKVRAQVVLKNKNAKDGSQTQELQEVRDQLAEVKEKYIDLRIQGDRAEAQQRHLLDEGQRRAAEQQQLHRQEVERLESQHRDELLRFEAELHKQRTRTTELLQEKELELQQLRSCPQPCQAPADNGPGLPGGGEDEDDDVIAQALWRATPTEPTLLLYGEQLARKEAELQQLRRQKHQLEDDLHQLQARLLADAERHEEEAEQLQGRVDKLARDQGRDGANLEYLKNILFRFLTLPDASGRQQTLSAILTILHFSPQERHSISRLQATTWWGGGGGGGSGSKR